MRTRKPRTGFTLIELLVVVAIIAVLAALATGAVVRFMDSQRGANTETVMQNVDKALQQAWAKVIADAKKEAPSANVYTLASGDPKLAQVIWINLRLMEAFPVTYAECNVSTNPLYTGNYIPTTSQRKYIASYQKMLGGATSKIAATESAACLLMALSINRGGGAVLNPDSIASNLLDTDGDGIKEIVDGWGTPVWFYRFATPDPTTWSYLNGMDLQSNNPAGKTTKGARYADPTDPNGLLLTMSGQASFVSLCRPVVYPGSNPVSSYYITPVIVSAGPNGTVDTINNLITGFGLVPPSSAPCPTLGWMSITSQDDANDNIYNYLLRLGGTGQ